MKQLELVLFFVCFSFGIAYSQVYSPPVRTTWQWQLSGDIDTSFNVEVYDIDLFETSQSTIDTLHSQNKKVICYFSAGTWEPDRPDSDDFPQSLLGNRLEDFPEEKWLDIRDIVSLRPIMEERAALAKQKNCDGVEPDNVDGYTNNSGFNLSAEDQINYNTMISEICHAEGLSVGLKNDLDQITELVDLFDFAVNEQCHQFDECDALQPFINQNKAVFSCEYLEEGATTSVCESSNAQGLSTIIKDFDLEATPFTACLESEVTVTDSPTSQSSGFSTDSSESSDISTDISSSSNPLSRFSTLSGSSAFTSFTFPTFSETQSFSHASMILPELFSLCFVIFFVYF